MRFIFGYKYNTKKPFLYEKNQDYSQICSDLELCAIISISKPGQGIDGLKHCT